MSQDEGWDPQMMQPGQLYYSGIICRSMFGHMPKTTSSLLLGNKESHLYGERASL